MVPSGEPIPSPMTPASDPSASANLHLSSSSLMRAYIDSLPDKVSIREELTSYQFWKSLRTEFLAAFLFFVFCSGSLFSRSELSSTVLTSASTNSSLPSEELEVKTALSIGLTVASLVQCAGHVGGCHLTIAVTLGLCVSGRVSTVRLAAYMLVQCIASFAGAGVIYALYGTVPTITPPPAGVSAAQVFGFEFLATFLVVLTYLANCDSTRIDLGFKSLSIGLAFSVAHLFAFANTGASLSPARALAASLLTSTWCLHWVYWVAPFVAGLFGGITYEYIGSIKPNATASSLLNGHPDSMTELKHQFTGKPTPSPSAHSMLTSPLSNYTISALGAPRSQSQHTLHLTQPVQANAGNLNPSYSSLRMSSPSPEAAPCAPLNAETKFGSLGAAVITSVDSVHTGSNITYSNGAIATGTGKW